MISFSWTMFTIKRCKARNSFLTVTDFSRGRRLTSKSLSSIWFLTIYYSKTFKTWGKHEISCTVPRSWLAGQGFAPQMSPVRILSGGHLWRGCVCVRLEGNIQFVLKNEISCTYRPDLCKETKGPLVFIVFGTNKNIPNRMEPEKSHHGRLTNLNQIKVG